MAGRELSTAETPDVVVVGAGIVGLAAARALARRGRRVVVLEKEAGPARHQSGRNSGVLHSGIYYAPGSLKARFAREGNRRLGELCEERGVPWERCGKVLLGTRVGDEERLSALADRGRENGVEARFLSPTELQRREPHVREGAALLVPSTGIVDFARVAEAFAEDVTALGGEVRYGVEVLGSAPDGSGIRVETTAGDLAADHLVGCAGLYCDRVARACGVDPPIRIVPFRGEYARLVPGARELVCHLVYPVPDPELPFLGVHVHRGVDGERHVGPNALPATAREGYRRSEVSLGDLADVLAWPGFWRLVLRQGPRGLAEMARATSRRAFARAARRLVPGLRAEHLEPAPAGIRAQALDRRGGLVDDFLVVGGEASTHVLNAPSPAATACLPIGDHLADLAEGRKEPHDPAGR